MQDMKHVGRLVQTGRKVLVAYRTIPGDAHYCLVIPTESLPDSYHDALITLVESTSAQTAFELADVLARSKFSDGSTMLPALHGAGKLLKVATDMVEMTPNFTNKISLAELNQLIAEQRNCTIDDLAVRDGNIDKGVEVVEVAKVTDLNPSAKTTSSTVNEEPSTPEVALQPDEQAKKYRSEADRLSKQAAELRRQAEALVPTPSKRAK